MMDINEYLLQCFINFLIKRLLVEVLKMRIFKKKELVRQLHKPTIRKFKRRKVQSPFIDNTWCADLADMH